MSQRACLINSDRAGPSLLVAYTAAWYQALSALSCPYVRPVTDNALDRPHPIDILLPPPTSRTCYRMPPASTPCAHAHPLTPHRGTHTWQVP